ncbi:MAG TPA: hypothetical protein VK973_07520, partial [Arenicellales bacterium]|nr:hypothetical protein [Arenicellales bacterium]
MDNSAAELIAENLSSGSALEALFALFGDESTALIELDAEHRIVRCNRGYAAACGCLPGDLEGTLPADLFTIHIVGQAASSPDNDAASPIYPYVAREEWLCKHGKHCSVAWLKLWTFDAADGRHYVKLGAYQDHEQNHAD